MSVVDGEWEDLKRYNLTELYNQATKSGRAEKMVEAAAKQA